MRMKVLLFLAFLSAILFIGTTQFSAMAAPNDPNWILGILFNLEKMRDNAAARIRKNDQTIRKANDLIRHAQATNQQKVEDIARQALAKALAAKKENQWQLKKAQAGIPRVQNLLAKASGQEAKIQSVVTQVSGGVWCHKVASDDWIDLNSNPSVYLAPGDKIRTGPTGQVELRLLEGEGTIAVGPNTRFTVRKPGLETELIELYEGTINSQVKKLAAEINKKFGDRFKVRTPTAIIAIRGTQFIIRVDRENGTGVIVLEGAVTVSDIQGTQKIRVEAGHQIKATEGQPLPEPSPACLDRLTRWWEAQ